MSSFWLPILVVFYLFMTSQAQSVEELPLTERQSKGGKFCSATQNKVKGQEKASVSSVNITAVDLPRYLLTTGTPGG